MKFDVHDTGRQGTLRFTVSEWHQQLHVRVFHRDHEIVSGSVTCADPPCHELFHFSVPPALAGAFRIEARDPHQTVVHHISTDNDSDAVHRTRQ